ncbi:hypothetical protein AB0N17_42625 [Streptomyces sp. NPDC051133]|uniref:hypothetical protein n=1 Tax=Streptomyces sp. NPDC051133 TaxID=3155521 RepID=UPI00344502B1
MSHLRLTTVRNLDGEPVATVNAQFVTSTHLPHSWLITATATADDDRDDYDNPTAHLDHDGPFADPDGARAWAEAHLAPHATRYAVVPLTAPYTYADVERALGKPGHASEKARPARANTIAKYFRPFDLTRLRYGTRTDTRLHRPRDRAPDLGPVVELTALGPDRYQRDRDHSLMQTVLRLDHPRYEVTDKHTHPLVRRLSDAGLHARADQAADRVAPHLAGLTANTAPSAFAEAAYTLFDAVLGAAREKASDDPDAYDLMLQVEDMAPPRRPRRPQEGVPALGHDRAHRGRPRPPRPGHLHSSSRLTRPRARPLRRGCGCCHPPGHGRRTGPLLQPRPPGP